jgi:HK97 gp10 family phage protein
MANKGTVRIEGAAELSAMLNAIPQELRKDIITTAVRSAASPLVKAAKAMAVTSVDTGALRKSIGFVVRKYKSGVNAVAVVGPRRGYYRNGRKLGTKASRKGADSPAKYAHLVEHGHVSRNGSFVAGHPFLRPAVAVAGSQVKNALIEGVGKGIEKVRAKLIKRGIHKA